MNKHWTRRKFLQTGLASSWAARAGAGTPSRAPAKTEKTIAAAELTADQRAALHVAMDELIPAADGMPAAGTVGGAEYLGRIARENSALRQNLARSLAELDTVSRKRFGKAFVALAPAERVKALAGLEEESPATFAPLRDLTYEAYYLQPQVWKLIGYVPHPTNEAGPPWPPFDEAVLAKVRRMPKRYKAVS